VEVSTKLRWSNELKFNAEVAPGRSLELNSAKEMGGAFTPMELFLVALAGCTAMDVQWIMRRERQEVDRFEVSAKGKRREEEPQYYESIDLEYVISGRNLTRNAIERAIRLSQEKYCSVRAMLKDNVRLNTTYTIIDPKGAEERFTYTAPANRQ
jgi:putative redox protein